MGRLPRRSAEAAGALGSLGGRTVPARRDRAAQTTAGTPAQDGRGCLAAADRSERARGNEQPPGASRAGAGMHQVAAGSRAGAGRSAATSRVSAETRPSPLPFPPRRRPGS